MAGLLMQLTVMRLAEIYPHLFHMAESGSWPSIMENGLLSTKALLDVFGIEGQERKLIESCHRPKSVAITHKRYGTAVIRDQIPMRQSALEKCLEGMAPQQWYEFLNGRVFFWLTRDRVETLLNARAYRSKEHLVLTVDSQALLSRYHDRVLLSPINSGSTIYRPVKRGPDTFKSISDYPFEERKRLRGVLNAVAEMAVDYAVPDIKKYVIRAERRHRPKLLETIFASQA
jgi:hypothetical protein